MVEQPKYGYLEIETNGRYLEVDFNYLFHPNNSEEAKDSAITYFDQAIVDAEKLHYIQVILNQTYDRVVLDASNGIMWCKNIVVSYDATNSELAYRYAVLLGLNVDLFTFADFVSLLSFS